MVTGVKLSQIASGGAANTSTDTAVAVRSGTTDVLVSLSAFAPGGLPSQVQYNSSGSFGGAAALIYSTSGNLLAITAQTATDVPLAIVGATSQSGKYITITNSSAAEIFSVDSIGSINFTTSITGKDNQITFQTNGATNSKLSLIARDTQVDLQDGGTGVTLKIGGSVKWNIQSAVIRGGSDTQYAWTSNLNPTAVSPDTGLARLSAGVIDVTNGSTGVGSINIGKISSATGKMTFTGTTSGVVTLSVADAAGTWTCKLPTTGGTNTYFLQTDGSGVTTWAQAAIPGQANTFTSGIQYLNGATVEEAVFSNGSSGTSKALNLDNGNFQSLTITGAVTITQTTPTHPGKYMIVITQDGTGHVYSFSGVKWPAGAQPTWSTAAGAIDLISFAYDGTNIYGVGNTAFA